MNWGLEGGVMTLRWPCSLSYSSFKRIELLLLLSFSWRLSPAAYNHDQEQTVTEVQTVGEMVVAASQPLLQLQVEHYMVGYNSAPGLLTHLLLPLES